MLPDLGKYVVEVTSAYVASLTILAILVVVYVLRARRTKTKLAQLENRRNA